MSIQLKGNSDSVFSNGVIAPNILVHQEGIWQPSLSSQAVSGGSFTPSTASNSNGGLYSRIGNLVTVTFNLSGTWTNGGATGQAWIIGLPYIVKDVSTSDQSSWGNGSYSTITIAYHAGVNVPANEVFATSLIQPGQTFCPLYTSGVQNTGSSPSLAITSINTTTNAVNIHASGSYFTDDTTWTPINGATIS